MESGVEHHSYLVYCLLGCSFSIHPTNQAATKIFL